MRLNIYICCCISVFILTTTAFAQNNNRTDSVVTEEIEVVRAYKPVLADAAKIRRSPDLNNRKPFKPNLSYNVFEEKFELNRDIKQLQAQQLPDERPEALRNNFVKIGAGNLNTGLGELYLNTGRDKALMAGMFFKHLNQEGKLNKQNISRQQAGVFGRSILDPITLNGEVSYDRLGSYFYGLNPANTLANNNPAKQRISTIALKGEILKNYSGNENDFTYAAKGDAYFFGNYYQGRENSFALSGFLNKAWDKFNFGVNSSLDFTAVKDSLFNTKNNIFRANPYVKLQGANYKLIVGLNFVQEFGTNPRTNVLPAVTAEVPIVPGYATIFGGFTGDVLKTSLRDLSFENPYLSPNYTINNAVEKTNIYGGVKGNAGAGFGYKALVFYKSIENMPFYIHNVGREERFDIIYDAGATKVVGLEGEISVNASEVFTWTGKVNINNFEPGTEKEAWYKPDFRLVSQVRLSLNKKFSLDADLLVNGQTAAKTFTPALEEKIVPVKSFLDLSAGAEYRFREKIGVYFRLNNILGKDYQQYLYYNKLGLNALAGFNYSF